MQSGYLLRYPLCSYITYPKCKACFGQDSQQLASNSPISLKGAENWVFWPHLSNQKQPRRCKTIFGYPFGLYLTYLKLEKVVLLGIPQRCTATLLEGLTRLVSQSNFVEFNPQTTKLTS